MKLVQKLGLVTSGMRDREELAGRTNRGRESGADGEVPRRHNSRNVWGEYADDLVLQHHTSINVRMPTTVYFDSVGQFPFH
ncbi:MAG: hypothetical protein WCE61_22835 [Candidatus Acidiferrum sp.]